jgi:hypothetical protein
MNHSPVSSGEYSSVTHVQAAVTDRRRHDERERRY